MSESTLSAWSLSIHVPRGGCGGGSIPQSFGFAVLVYIFAKMYLNTSFMTSLGCSIGIHLPEMCTSTKFPMFSFVRGSNPRACTNTWETRETHEKKRGIHEKNVKFMTELIPEAITVSSHPSIPLFPPPLPSSFPFLAGLVCSRWPPSISGHL